MFLLFIHFVHWGLLSIINLIIVFKKKLCQVLSTSAMDFAMGCSWPYVNRKSSLPNVMKFVRSNNVLFFAHTITCHAPEESLIFVYSYKVWCLYSTFKVNLTFMVSYDSIVWQLSVYISFFFLSDRVSFSHSLFFLRCHSVIMAFSCILGDNMDPTMGPKPGKIFILSNIFLDVLSWISWSVYFHSDVVIKYSLFILNSSRPGQNGHHFPDDIFKMHFHEWKNLYFDSNFTEVCS